MSETRAGLVRERLGDAGGLPAHRLTVVVAPAGSGKTTLLTHRAAAAEVDVVRVRLEAADRDPMVLARHLRQAVAGIRPGTRCLLDRDLLGGDLTALGRDEPLILMLDDVHHLVGTAAERALEDMLAATPPTVRVVLAGRRLPQMNLCRHELDPVRLIDGDDLRFRTWEVERLFRDVYAEPLLPADAALLTRRVGGWAAGLQMFHLSTRGRTGVDRGSAVRALDGRLSMSQAYLARTVIADMPEEIRDFLVRTCVFRNLTARRCDALLGGAHSAAHLVWLAERQAFTDTPDQGRTYRYHEALRLHLEIALAETVGDEEARRWHRRAGGILEADDAPMDALHAYARAADWAAVRSLLPRLGGGVADEPWSDLLPQWLVAEEPWLLLAEGRHLLVQGRVDDAVRSIREADAMARHPAEHAAARGARALVAVAQVPAPGQGPAPTGTAGWVGLLATALQRGPGEVRDAAASLAGPPGRLVRAVVAVLARNTATARRETEEPGEAGRSLCGLALDLLRVALDADEDRPTADVDAERVAVAAEAADLGWLSRLARAVPGLHGAAGGVKEARRVAEECARDGDAWGSLLAGAAACRGEHRQGLLDPADARPVVELARRLGADVVAEWASGLAAAPPARAGRRVARVRCLGGFSLEVDDASVDLGGVRPRARTVLRFLALRAREPVHRESLLAALWPDAPAGSATRSLHVALSSLRSLLATHPGLARLHRDGDAYRLEPEPATWFDVGEFRAALATAGRTIGDTRADALRVALDTYRGDLLPEDGPAEWVVAERERLRLAAAGAAAELAEVELASGRPEAVVEAAQRCVDLDACSDAGWRLLVEGYDRLGDPMARARAERRYAAMLQDLGVAAPAR